jgi:hypothetical protein
VRQHAADKADHALAQDECHAVVSSLSTWHNAPCLRPAKGERMMAGQMRPVCGIHLRAKFPPTPWRWGGSGR